MMPLYQRDALNSASIALRYIESLPGILEFILLRRSSNSVQAICDRVSLRTLELLLQRGAAAPRATGAPATVVYWLECLLKHLQRDGFETGTTVQRDFVGVVRMVLYPWRRKLPVQSGRK